MSESSILIGQSYDRWIMLILPSYHPSLLVVQTQRILKHWKRNCFVSALKRVFLFYTHSNQSYIDGIPTVLDISDREVIMIDPKSFESMSVVDYLLLNGNKMTTIEDNTFLGLD